MSGLGNMVDLVELWGGRARDLGVKSPSGLENGTILRTIESEIIPRLLISHAPGLDEQAPRDIGQEDIAELARLVVAHDLETIHGFIRAVRADGLSLEDVMMDLIAPAAQLLGELWSSDRATFGEVTMGLSRLQRLALELGMETGEPIAGEWRGRVLLAPVPGEQHGLGLRMVVDFLCGDGWGVDHFAVADSEELVEAVHNVSYAMVGLTLSNDRLAETATRLISRLRRASCNPDLIVLVGGGCSSTEAQVRSLGADASPVDARATVQYMQTYHDQVLVTRSHPRD